MKGRKEHTELVRLALAAGWTQRRTKKGIALYPPDGGSPVVCHLTPSDRRSVLNARADLRRRGLNV